MYDYHHSVDGSAQSLLRGGIAGPPDARADLPDQERPRQLGADGHDAFEEHLANAAYRRYIDDALAEASCNKLAGTSRYQAMETAIAELLDEPFSLDGEGSDDGSRHATA